MSEQERDRNIIIACGLTVMAICVIMIFLPFGFFWAESPLSAESSTSHRLSLSVDRAPGESLHLRINMPVEKPIVPVDKSLQMEIDIIEVLSDKSGLYCSDGLILKLRDMPDRKYMRTSEYKLYIGAMITKKLIFFDNNKKLCFILAKELN